MSTWAGNLIRLARRQKGLSQRDLARRARTSQAAIAAYESGRRSPTLETLSRIIRGAGLDLRIRLEEQDDHDQWLARYEAGLSPTAADARRRRDAELVAASGAERAARSPRAVQTKATDE
jgi:transcriptional regulator with XRE-family HTH domain